MKKYKLIIIAMLTGILIFNNSYSVREVKANDSSISSSEVVNSTENNVNLTEEQVEEIVLKISNKLLGEELTDKLFGVFGIGIIFIILIYVVFQINERKKNSDLGKLLVKNNDDSNRENSKTLKEIKEKLGEYEELISKQRSLNEILANQNNSYVKELTILANQTHEDLVNVTEGLKKYEDLESKIDAIIKIEAELMKKPSNITNGISSKVLGIIKEVNSNEEN